MPENHLSQVMLALIVESKLDDYRAIPPISLISEKSGKLATFPLIGVEYYHWIFDTALLVNPDNDKVGVSRVLI